jgi:hypothetical protein
MPHSDAIKAHGIKCFMNCGAHIVANDVAELSTRSMASTHEPRITPLTEADVLKFDVFQYNANLREAFAETPEVLVHCPVSCALHMYTLLYTVVLHGITQYTILHCHAITTIDLLQTEHLLSRALAG